MTSDAYDRVTSRLAHVTNYVPRGGKGDWRCPAHDDSTASLSVARGNEGVILHCHAGCQTDDVLAALDLKPADLFDTPNSGRNGNRRDEPDGVYKYIDETGTLLFEVVRYPGKQFRQRIPNGHGGWEWKLGNTRRVLYRLDRVLDAVRTGKPVFVVEGEKDVHAVERAGGVATCNPGGAGKWRSEYADALKGAEVVVVADQDPTGLKHAADVEASLTGKARRVRVVNPAVGKDAFDHLTGGHTLDEWLQGSDGLQRALLGSMLRSGVPEPAMVHTWLYAGGLHSIQSEPGVGKSWFALWLCAQLIEAGWTVIYIDEEGGQELVAERLQALGCDPDIVDRRFWYFPFPERVWNDNDIDALREQIDAAQQVGPLACAVLDSLPDFLASAGVSENDSVEITRFVRRLDEPLRTVGTPLIVLDHIGRPDPDATKRKRSKYARGSGAKLAKAHLTLLLEADPEFDRSRSGKLKLWATKDRRGFTGLPRLGDNPLELLVHTGDGNLRIEVADRAESGGISSQGPTHCMADVEHVLRLNPGLRHSPNQLVERLQAVGKGYRRLTVSSAAGRLVHENPEKFHAANGPRGAIVYWYSDDTKEQEVPLEF